MQLLFLTVLWFYLRREEKQQLLRKSRVSKKKKRKEESSVGTDAGEKMPCWESTALVRWCFSFKKPLSTRLQTTGRMFCPSASSGCGIYPSKPTYRPKDGLGPTPRHPETHTQAGTVRGGLTVLSIGSADCPHCQRSWQG